MLRLRFFLLFTLILLLTGGLAAAQDEGPILQSTDAFWEAAYWNNQSLSGEPVLRRTEQALDWDWGDGGPEGVGSESFSARWTRIIETPAPRASYRFTVSSDDGIRVWIDDQLIVDDWTLHPVRTVTVERTLPAGHHQIRVEYFEDKGQAVAKVGWQLTQPGGEGWWGEYYDNRWFSGSPIYRQTDPVIAFDWGRGAPSNLPADGFSIRWTRGINTDAGTYRFTARADDGIRLWVDGRLVISEWRDQPAQTFFADVPLSAGSHELKVEYYENWGLAAASVAWERVNVDSGSGLWRGEYYRGRLPGAANSLLLVRQDPEINFVWGAGSPAPGIPADDFSVRWRGTLSLEPGVYRFTIRTDDGARLYVDGNLVLDRWFDQPYNTHIAALDLGGEVPVQLDYYEHGGAAAVSLTWERMTGGNPAPDGLLVGIYDQGFRRGGPAGSWFTGHGGHQGEGYLRVRNYNYVHDGYSWARWYPTLAAGRYEVFAFVPLGSVSGNTHNARYWIAHRDGYTLRSVDQQESAMQWVSLGSYWFRGNGADYVSLANVTFERENSTDVLYDAIRWEAR